MPVLIPLEKTNLGFHSSFSRLDRDQAACLCSFGLTKTFYLCIQSASSTENIRCAQLRDVNSLSSFYKLPRFG